MLNASQPDRQTMTSPRSSILDPNPASPRIIVALDFPDSATALALVGRLDAGACGVKIGKELFTSAGPDLVRACVERGFRVFLDLKFHDIPNTASQACAAATRLGVWMLNVHASGGAAMLAAAREGVERAAKEATRPAPLLIAVTVLTSLSDADLSAIGVNGPVEQQVLKLAKLAQSSGLAGVVCSAQEAATLRVACGSEFTLVTPGIRLADAHEDDQTRIATPQSAIRAGADYLVIGRPITRSADPRAALAAIRASIGEGA
jgi:orotidine-5'-phosphate decarboxylase